MPKERRDIPARPRRKSNTNVLLADERNELWGFGVIDCTYCHGMGVAPYRQHQKLCVCVLRGVARYVLGMVNRIRHGAASLSLLSIAAPGSYYTLCNYCADVDLMIREKLDPSAIPTLSGSYDRYTGNRDRIYH